MPTLSTNRKAFADYLVLEEIEAGLVLSGPEVKSIKASQINLKGSYISIDEQDEAWLVGAHVSKYKPASVAQQSYNPSRKRKLLLNKREIDYIRGKEKESGLTIVPLSVYTRGDLIKLKIAIVRGKKKFDKREAIKKRESDRKIARALRRKY